MNGQVEVDEDGWCGGLWGDRVWSMQQKCGGEEGVGVQEAGFGTDESG